MTRIDRIEVSLTFYRDGIDDGPITKSFVVESPPFDDPFAAAVIAKHSELLWAKYTPDGAAAIA